MNEMLEHSAEETQKNSENDKNDKNDSNETLEETQISKPDKKESPVEPFLPKIKNKIYTLVLDLDETLVHYVEVIKILINHKRTIIK